MIVKSFGDYDIDEQQTVVGASGKIELNPYLLRFTNTENTGTIWFELVPLHMYYSGNVNLSIPLGVASGGTGASTAAGALANLGAIPASQKGAASGVAELDSNGIVPLSQLPNIVEYVNIGRLSTEDIIAGKNLVEMGICSVTSMYIIILGSQSTQAQDLWSMYCVRKTGSNFVFQSTIHEGTNALAPRINADGTISRADGGTITSNYTVRYALIRIPT